MKLPTDKAHPGLILLTLCILVCGPHLRAQTGSAKVDSAPASLAESNLAVPDYPAFAILGSSPSEILHPNSPHDFGSIIANNFNKGLTIPESFAFETSPWLLFAPKSTLKDYNSTLSRFRFSAGVISPDSGGRSIAVGLRLSLFDNTDLRSDSKFRSSLYRLADSLISIQTANRDTILNKFNINMTTYAAVDSIRRFVDHLVECCSRQSTAAIDSAIVKARQSKETEVWNASQLELAAAYRWSSTTEIPANFSYGASSAWITGSAGVSDFLQFIGSIRMLSEHVSDSHNHESYSGALQVNLGRPDVRLSSEIDCYYSGKPTAQFGASFRLSDQLWINGSVGWKHLPSTPTEFVKSINFSLTPLH